MIALLKTILKGFMYILFLPTGLIGISLYAIFGIFVFIYQFGKFIFLFFTGRNFDNELKEDIEANNIIEANIPKENNKVEPALPIYPSESEMYNSDYVSPIFSNEKEDSVEIEEGEDNE